MKIIADNKCLLLILESIFLNKKKFNLDLFRDNLKKIYLIYFLLFISSFDYNKLMPQNSLLIVLFEISLLLSNLWTIVDKKKEDFARKKEVDFARKKKKICIWNL